MVVFRLFVHVLNLPIYCDFFVVVYMSCFRFRFHFLFYFVVFRSTGDVRLLTFISLFAVPGVLEDSEVRRDGSALERLPGSQEDRNVHRPQWPSTDGNPRRQW